MKLRALLSLLVVALLMAACGGGGGVPGKDSMEKMAVMLENLTGSLEKADSADAVAAALNTYSDAMEKLVPEMQKLFKEHPELKKMDEGGKEIPAAYKDVIDRITKASEKMMPAMMNASKFMQEEVVQKAQQRFAAISQKMAE